MQGKRILVVEDDRITALDVQNGLRRLGYDIAGVVARGEDAVDLASGVDVVLMDIYLEGSLDGVEAARLIRERHDIPVVFLTVLSDVETLGRALEIEPFGYIIKPFELAALRSALEIAIYKHALERRLGILRSLLDNDPQPVVCADVERRIVYANPSAHEFFGRAADEFIGADASVMGVDAAAVLDPLSVGAGGKSVLTIEQGDGRRVDVEASRHLFEHGSDRFACLRLLPLAVPA